jgi:hypothetical protein
MFWGGFGYNGTLNLQKINTKLDSKGYQNILNNALNSSCHRIVQYLDDKITFQQDNSSIHTSKSTKVWLRNKENINILEWPSKSPDLNPIENIWGYISKRIYAHGKQYNNKQELEEAIINEWNSLDLDYLKKLIDSMPGRIGKVLMNQGRFISN